MILGIGIDILSIARFEAVASRRGAQTIAKRICSAREFQEWLTVPESKRIGYLASRWAIKEAAYKSLYPHFKTSFKSFDLARHPWGQPSLRLVAPTRIMGSIKVEEVDLMATISHDAGVIVGVVIAQTKT